MIPPRRRWARPAAIAAAAAALIACGSDEAVVEVTPVPAPAPAAAAPAAPAPNPTGPGDAAPAAAATPEAAANEEYEYNPIGKRDPFRSFLSDEAVTQTRALTPLQRYDIDQIRVVGVIWGISTPRAMVVTPDGKAFVVQKGTLIGRPENWGKVSRITQDEVVVSQEYRDFEGKAVSQEVSIKMPRENQGLEELQ